MKWQRLADGSHLAPEVPVRLHRNDRTVPYQVSIPFERDESFDDGWQWINVVYTHADQRYNLPGAKEWVEENVDSFRKDIATDYDGDPVAAAEKQHAELVEWRRSNAERLGLS